MFFNFKSLRRAAAFSLLALVTGATATSEASAQKASEPAQTGGAVAAAAQAKTWSVKMSKSAPHTFTVKAAGSKLSEVVAEISRLAKVPVTLSPSMQKQRVSLDFGGLNFDATLRMLAPQPVVDYESGGDDPQPRALAVYLQGSNETPPAPGPEMRGTSQAILIEGDTEEGTEREAQKEEEDPLRVTYSNSQLSVHAKKQPLSVVLFKIANELGVPFDLRHESPLLIDVEFDGRPVDQAVRSLSPEVRLYYRQDLQTFQIQPLRLALVSPAAAKS
ncbi:MAG TPA: hypothetical protein VM914_03820 [Pyrinomonadaceae bacterium]|nr:hypothetical protein [Pyrinomonadaceae bacterium]